MTDAADVAGKAGLEGMFVRVEVEVEGDCFVGYLDASEVFDLFEGEIEFVFLFGDVVAEALEVVGGCVEELAGFGGEGCF